MSSSNLYSGNFNKNFALQNDLTLQARAIQIINIFRFVLSLIFVVIYANTDKFNVFPISDPALFFGLALLYMLYSVSLLIVSPLNSNNVVFFHPIQIVIDLIFIILMMHAAGGIQSGLGLLLIISIVTASLVSDGRLALFYAAVATIGLLLEQSYQIASTEMQLFSYTQSVMLSLSCFATAGLAYSLAKRILQTEALASSREVDLANMSQVNELIAQEMQDGVIVVDQNMSIRHYNAQAELQLSLENRKSPSYDLRECLPEIADRLLKWMDGDSRTKEALIVINNKELSLRFEPVNQNRRNAGAVIFIQDWSRIQAAAQQTKLAALGRLTANIAHEIRNPLSAISHANQLLQEEAADSVSNQRILEIIGDNVQRINQIIKDVLELNRRDRTQQEEIAVDDFILNFHSQFCAIEKIPPTHFITEQTTRHTKIIFDSGHLMQILWNICKNAWEHSQQRKGSIKLTFSETPASAKNTEGFCQFELIDDGPGISESERNKIFEPFYTTKTTGNGLGLYISRELADANNAKLIYQPLPKGSAFILQIKKRLS